MGSKTGNNLARRELAAACVLLAFTLAFGVLTLRLPDRGLPNTPGPAFFPSIITLALAVLSIALLVRSLRATGADSAGLAVPLTKRGWLGLGIFLVYLLAVPVVGFLTASVPFFAALSWAYGERRLLVIALTSIVVPTAIYFVFGTGFQILLPRGIGW